LITLAINSLADYDKFRSNLRVARLQLPGFQKQTLRDLSEEILLPKIHQKMGRANYQKEIIFATIIKDVIVTKEKFTVIVKSEVLSGDTSYDMARVREEGTGPYDIFSKGDWPLHWQDSSGEEVYVSTKNKPVKHPGIEGSQIIESTIDENKDIIELVYLGREKEWFRGLMA